MSENLPRFDVDIPGPGVSNGNIAVIKRYLKEDFSLFKRDIAPNVCAIWDWKCDVKILREFEK